MATLSVIKQQAIVEGMAALNEDAIVTWWSTLFLFNKKAKDVTVPEGLGSMDAVEKFCDTLGFPFCQIDRPSRCASVALSYTSLKEHEDYR